MSVGESIRRSHLRDRLLAAVVLLAVAVAAITWASTTQELRGEVAVLIVPPQLGTESALAQNPLLHLGADLGELATVLETAMASPSAAGALHQQDATAAFTVSTAPPSSPLSSYPAPELVFTVTGSGATQVERTATALMSVARDQLDGLQSRAQVPGSARATLVTVVGPSSAVAVGAGRVRIASTAGIVVLVLGVLAVLGWDFATRRRSRSTAPPRPRTRRRERMTATRSLEPATVPTQRSR